MLPSRTHHFILGTFRAPYLYSFSFDPTTHALVLEETLDATGGHSWLHLSSDRKFLYTTGWTDPPTLAAYRVTAAKGYPVTELINTVKLDFLSGYVTSNGRSVFSASGPQGDVFSIDPSTGGFGTKAATQTVRFIDDDVVNSGNQLDFGGLRHGGHSADLSPDGTKLYIADIGRNCIWSYSVDPLTDKLNLLSKTGASRPDAGPRHCWLHPNGRVVYCVNEHSSTIDVYEHEDGKLFKKQEVSIIPEGEDCSKFWADEVRLSLTSNTLFGSTRGLKPSQKGYLTSFPLLSSGFLPSSHIAPSHVYQTRTSGGWANAIAIAPVLSDDSKVYMTLTDAEEGFVQILEWTELEGFMVVAERRLGDEGVEIIGASVAVWYD